MNKTSTKGLQIKEKPKTDETKKEGHQGSTAAFLVQETSDAINAIRAKLESAERRTGISYGKGAKVQSKKNVNEFVDPIKEDQEENDQDIDDEFKKPVSGRSSRSKKGKESVQTAGSRGNIKQTQNYKTPSPQNDGGNNDSNVE